MDLLDRMLGHDHWATACLLERCAALDDAQLDQEFDIGHRTLRETLDHLIFEIDSWTGWMLGRPVETERAALSYDRSLPSLAERHERFHAAFADLALRARDEGRLDHTFIDHSGVVQSLGATIAQVLCHNVEHRAELRHILARLGVLDLPETYPQNWEHAAGHIPRV